MPIYTYQCDECGVRFDARQKFSDEPISVCPECGSHTHRVPQPVGIVFKGSGWYAKDSKGSNSLATPGKRDTDGESNGAKGESKSETKSEAKSESQSGSSSSGTADSKSSTSKTE